MKVAFQHQSHPFFLPGKNYETEYSSNEGGDKLKKLLAVDENRHVPLVKSAQTTHILPMAPSPSFRFCFKLNKTKIIYNVFENPLHTGSCTVQSLMYLSVFKWCPMESSDHTFLDIFSENGGFFSVFEKICVHTYIFKSFLPVPRHTYP